MNSVTVEETIDAIRRGALVLVVDDSSGEIEGDLVVAAEMVTVDVIDFMMKRSGGLICLAMEEGRLDELGLSSMSVDEREPHETAFTVSIDLADRSGSGFSAEDRTRTIRAAIDPDVPGQRFRRPGHVFPLRSMRGGVAVHAGRTEAAVDLARLAGLTPAGVLCEVVDEDGTVMRGESLQAFAEHNDLPIISIDALSSCRWRTGILVDRESEASIPTLGAVFRGIGYRTRDIDSEHIALVLGDVEHEDDVLVRLHSACLTGDVFASLRCDCGAQLAEAMKLIAEEGRGVIVYNPTHEGRGVGLIDKLAAYRLQEQGLDTAEANQRLGHPVDDRHYGVDAQILRDLEISSVRLLTNNPDKIAQLRLFGVTVSERVPLWVGENSNNSFYLETKEKRLGHLGHGA